MGLEGIMLREINHIMGIQILYNSLILRILKKKNRFMEAESRLVIARSEERKTKRVKVIKRYKLPVMRKVKSWGYNIQYGDYS